MKFIADLHIHSRFSRATSRDLDPERLSIWASRKGIAVLGTGDFTHPAWFSELQEKLIEDDYGLYTLRPDLQKTIAPLTPPSWTEPTHFLFSGEISCIYKKDGKTRKVHHLILMPDSASVIRFNHRLSRIGNLTSDGRPILGLDSRALLEIALEASERAFLIPAHIWTPWFSLLGSKSGFDSLEECFGDLSPYIRALETGLSSDPPMNRLLSSLDSYVLVSNSDAHSPGKLGREANVFDTDLGYDHMVQAMSGGEGFLGTIEFFPEEGKYHLDGHRKCQVRLEPWETREAGGACSICGRPLTVGVLHRVTELSDRRNPKLTHDSYSLIPLPEILGEILGCGPSAKKVMGLYEELLSALGPELNILREIPLDRIEKQRGPLLAEALRRMRCNRVIREPGYDGQYGVIRLFEESELETLAGQMSLFKPKGGGPSRPKRSTFDPAKKAEREQEEVLQKPGPPEDPILGLLNPEQREAVRYRGGHLLIVAGPGTGKTLTLTHRIAHVLQDEDFSGRILALTFTRKAAREMEKRMETLLGDVPHDRITVSTFHGLFLEILREEWARLDLSPDFTLCSESDIEDLIQETSAGGENARISTRRFRMALPRLKRATFLEEEEESFVSEFSVPFKNYQARLNELHMVDFDDLEVMVLRLFRDHPQIGRTYAARVSMIFVDEYQDTNRNQVDFLKVLNREGRSEVCAIGDPDQAIYGFRGVDGKNFCRFSEDFPGAHEIVLRRNYRSTRIILRGSAAVLGKKAPLESKASDGEVLRLASCRTDAEEAEMVIEHIERLIGGTSYFSLDSGRVASHQGERSLGFADIAVLYRLNIQGDSLEKAFQRAGIPFVRSGGKPLISRYPANLLWRFFQVLRYPETERYWKAYTSLYPQGEGTREGLAEAFSVESPVQEILPRATKWHHLENLSDPFREPLRRLQDLAAGFDGDLSGFLDLLSLERGIDHFLLTGDRVALMSLHAAKGLEWSVVFITGCEDRLLPCRLFGDRDDTEERRLFYVGMTRAQSTLILSWARRRSLNGRTLQMNPSPFLDPIPRDIARPLQRGPWRPKGKQRQLHLFE